MTTAGGGHRKRKTIERGVGGFARCAPLNIYPDWKGKGLGQCRGAQASTRTTDKRAAARLPQVYFIEIGRAVAHAEEPAKGIQTAGLFFTGQIRGDLRGSPRCFRFGECSKLGARWLLTMRSLLPGHSNECRLSYREQKTAGDADPMYPSVKGLGMQWIVAGCAPSKFAWALTVWGPTRVCPNDEAQRPPMPGSQTR